ncbi:hypothetical protein, partial [uncultured Prevotella sp.]|uniref:hypothetical protein n=1 Tax=uncultured Prevotella sp. TaxID=159272 RepID=UPI002587435C
FTVMLVMLSNCFTHSYTHFLLILNVSTYISISHCFFLGKMEMKTHFSRQPFLLQMHASSSKSAVFVLILMAFRVEN